MASLPGLRAVAAVTLQLGGVSLRAGFRCEAPSGLAGAAVESFLVQVHRCCSCFFTCADEDHMTSHLRSHLSPAPTAGSHLSPAPTPGSHSPGHMMSTQDFSQSGDKEEDEDLFLYDMFDISAQGEELQVGHTCQVSSLFEEDCSLFKEDTDQSAHLRTLGLCRITAPPPRSPAPSPPRSPTPRSPAPRSPAPRTSSRNLAQTKPVPRTNRVPRVRSEAVRPQTRLRTSPESTELRPAPSSSPEPRPRKKPNTAKPAVHGKKSWEKIPQKQKIFSCSECHRTFSSALTLRRHAGVHSDLRPFRCSLCPYSSRLKASLQQHQRTHSGERPHVCAVCSYASIDRSSLLRHQRTHNDERPHQCQLCPYSSIQKKSLVLHLQRHHSPL